MISRLVFPFQITTYTPLKRSACQIINIIPDIFYGHDDQPRIGWRTFNNSWKETGKTAFRTEFNGYPSSGDWSKVIKNG
jgi:hypothetical protein